MIKQSFSRGLIRISVLFIFLTGLFGLQPTGPARADTDPGTGPGGVERTDGTGTLVLWLDANNILGSDGSPVSSWNDKSGWGNNATQTTPVNQPTLQTVELNGQSTVRFDGIADFTLGDWLKITDSSSLDNTDGLTMFMVITQRLFILPLEAFCRNEYTIRTSHPTPSFSILVFVLVRVIVSWLI